MGVLGVGKSRMFRPLWGGGKGVWGLKCWTLLAVRIMQLLVRDAGEEVGDQGVGLLADPVVQLLSW